MSKLKRRGSPLRIISPSPNSHQCYTPSPSTDPRAIVESTHSLPKHADLVTDSTSKLIKMDLMDLRHEHNVSGVFAEYAGTLGGFRFAGCCSPTAEFSVRQFPIAVCFSRDLYLEAHGYPQSKQSCSRAPWCLYHFSRIDSLWRVHRVHLCSSLWPCGPWELGLPLWLGDRHRPLEFYSHRGSWGSCMSV